MEAAQRAKPDVDVAAEIHNTLHNAVEMRSLVLRIMAAKAEGDTIKVDLLRVQLPNFIKL
ncbi:MAG: hypothetical protein AAFS07_00675 [Pseudomonadota bacterium]